MRNGIPLAYWFYRIGWSVFHLALVLVLLVAFGIWFVVDGHGAAAVGGIWAGVIATQQAVANAIPFPWGG